MLELLLRRRSRGPAAPPQDRHGFLLESPSEQWVQHAYQLILGREPDSAQVIREKLRHPNVDSLRRELIDSHEFRFQLPQVVARPPNPAASRDRLTWAFIHIPKTAGTSIRALLESGVTADGRPCALAPLVGHLYEYPPGMLAQYDLFCGHFDYESLRYIPRDNIRVMCVFRDPVDRLVSLYRFARAKIPGAFGVSEGPFVALANRLPAEEFFEHPRVRSTADVFNTYLLTIGRSHDWYASRLGSIGAADLAAALEDAQSRIRRMAVVGIVERYAETVDLVCRALGIAPRPGSRCVTPPTTCNGRTRASPRPLLLSARRA